jgi:bacterioferritin
LSANRHSGGVVANIHIRVIEPNQSRYLEVSHMGTRARSIIPAPDLERILVMLNQAYASEWLAYYQYWLAAKLARGAERTAVAAEFSQHASEELAHADKLADRIILLGGVPIDDPINWKAQSPCKYDAPTDVNTMVLLRQNIEGEQCAISTYNTILAFVKDRDPVTHDLIREILADEEQHEEDLQNLQEDIHLMLAATK